MTTVVVTLRPLGRGAWGPITLSYDPRVRSELPAPMEFRRGQVDAAARVPSSGLRVSIDVLVTHDSRSLLPSISVPTMVAVGELDSETPVEYARALADPMPRSVLHVVSGAGHLLNVEAPGAVNALLSGHFAAAEREH